MKILGTDLKSDHAIITILEGDSKKFNVVSCKTRKLNLENSSSVEEVKSFKSKFEDILKEHKIKRVIIKKRIERGMYAGAAGSFKLEGIIQLNSVCEVEIISAQKIRASVKKNPVDFPKEINDFQEASFETAYAYLKIK